jgi:hypothetical protein
MDGTDATNHLTNRPNTAGYSTDENFSWVVENLLYFNKTFSEKHSLDVTLLQSAQKSRREGVSANVSGTVVPISYFYDLASNLNGRPDGYGTSYTENTLASFMGRLNYTFMDKYLLTASGRYDGASVLATDHKWDFFPSFALAWKMQEEGFIRGISWIDELKPRISYGITGNSSVNPYSTSGPLSEILMYLDLHRRLDICLNWYRIPIRLGKNASSNLGLDFSVIKEPSGSIEFYTQILQP